MKPTAWSRSKPGAAGDEADAWPAGELALRLGHEGGAALLPADQDVDAAVAQDGGEFGKRPGIFQECEVFVDAQFGGTASQQYLPTLLELGSNDHEGCADTSVKPCRCRHESG